MTGAQWIVKALAEQGVNIVFGYPGGAIMPVYDALLDGKIEHLLCRHEQGAIFAAIGYARVTKKVGVCIVTSGPGATNIITGLADALLDSVPIIAITGQVGLNLIGTDAFQEVDIIGLSLACTKHSFLVQSLHTLPDIINKSFIIASSGRPGPVLIDIPKDIQSSSGNLFSCCNIDYKTYDIAYQDIEKANILIRSAKKPILYIGGGVNIASAVQPLRELIKKTEIPSVVTLKGIGSVNYKNTYYLGMLGMHGNQAANLAVQQCDLLIAIGARFDDRVTGRLNDFAPEAKVIHVDIDPAELNKLRIADITLLGNLNKILPMLKQKLSIKYWHTEIKKLKSKYRWRYDSPGNCINAPKLLKNISILAPKNTVITTDVGQHQMWVAQHMHFDNPEYFITSGGLGTMGFGIPAAIGAQIAYPNHTVICITGDGSFMMNMQELATIKRKQLPVKIVLLDNQRLGMVKQWQEIFFNERYSETTLTDNPDFIMLANAFNIKSLHIKYKHQIKDALHLLFNYPGSFLLHIPINASDNVWPLVPPGEKNENMLEKK